MNNSTDKIPSWLERANHHLKFGQLEHFTMDMVQIRIKDILTDSCFYLSAGADITPIVAFKDIIYSYILCDLYLYTSIEGIENKFNGILVKMKDRLNQQGLVEIQKFNLSKRFLGIKDSRWSIDYNSEFQNCEISFWNMEDKLYSVLYINHDNTRTYRDLYIRNGMMPKAICELLSEDGGLRLTVKEKKDTLPEYVLGHLYSIGDIEQYERISENVEYFGDFLYRSGEKGKHSKVEKSKFEFLQIHRRKNKTDSLP
ncbi:MAG: hypothetical protein J0L62_11645 [Bacteroidetes bacterium]|nr:hypothetical protein [Bacteroidota bacterium]